MEPPWVILVRFSTLDSTTPQISPSNPPTQKDLRVQGVIEYSSV